MFYNGDRQQDAYYTALYRQHDPNVHQRLRAWRPHVEVLLPWSLRQQFGAEAHQEAAFY
jgi:CRISPR-associated protein (TIGR03985 family)